MEEKVRPIYQELQGYLSQTPQPKEQYTSLAVESSWEQVNQAIKSLNEITKRDYSKFEIEPEISGGDQIVRVVAFRQKLGGLIDYLHAEYFKDEPRPFSGSPSTIMSQNQTQNVSVKLYIQLGVDLQKAMERAETEEEKSFLKSVLAKIETVKTFMDFALLLASMASQYGITVERLKGLLGG